MFRRFTIVAALLAVVAALTAASASAIGSPTLTLVATPNPVASLTSTVTFSGTLTDGVGDPISGATIDLVEFTDSACTNNVAADHPTTDLGGNYSDTTTVAQLGTAPYFQAFYDDSAASACILLGVGITVAPHVNSIFLCYSKFQVEPGVWSDSDALALVKQGYWEPTAVDGNVEGGTNVGAYHLVCNATPKGDGWVGDNGQWFGPIYAQTAAEELGFYAH